MACSPRRHLLLLHGYTQNEKLFTKSVAKLMKKAFLSKFNVIVPRGPYVVCGEEKRGWWELSSPYVYSKPHEYVGVDLAIASVVDALAVVADGDELSVVGFSQGAVLAELMLVHRLFPAPPKKVVLFSPSGILDPAWRTDGNTAESDVLVVMGENEQEVFGISEASYAKESCLVDYVFAQHPHGHVLPTSANPRKLVREWLG